MTAPPVPVASTARGWSLANTIDAIGTGRFAPELAVHLREVAKSDHCAIFRLQDDTMHLVDRADVYARDYDGLAPFERYVNEQHWRHDPSFNAARTRGAKCPVLVRVDPHEIADTTLREDIYLSHNVCDRIVLSGQRGGSLFGLSVIRTDEMGDFSDADIQRLMDEAEILIALISRHADLLEASACGPASLISLPLIENRLGSLFDCLSQRERQVCARILYGMSAEGIGLDLEIVPETVITYKKRAFQRLGIATRHELLLLYLGDRHDA